MKELDSFTVEQLNDFIKSDHAQCGDVAALAAIALAAKRAEPVAWKWRGAVGDIWTQEKRKADFVKENCPELPVTELYTTPQLNSQVPLGSWINCSDQMPEDDQVVAIVDAGHGCFYGGAVVSRSGPNFHLIGGLSAENYDGGAVVELDMEATHWMPLPTPPEKENG
ncbi:TPA: DUF551 domain-containing protein [Yersinia enterocolitica]